MKLRLFRWLFVPLFVIGLVTPSVMRAQSAAPAAQAAPAPAAPALTESIPFDAAVTTGTLPNGLKYYIRRNTRPEKRVSLQLAVKAGSVDEENDQQGLAHFLEHMAFNGTETLQARRADCGAGVDRRAARPARQRLHIVRRNGLHVPAADRQAGPGRKRHAGAGGLRRRHEPRSGGDRQGARRRDRGVARRARRGLTPARSADPRPLLRVQVRRTPAHRQAGHSQGLQAGTAARLLHEVVPPRPHGDRRRRRHHGRRDGSDGAQGVRRPDETGGGRAGPHLRGAAADRPAGQDGDRPRSDAVIGLLDQQAAADAGGNRRRVPPQTWCTGWRSRC